MDCFLQWRLLSRECPLSRLRLKCPLSRLRLECSCLVSTWGRAVEAKPPTRSPSGIPLADVGLTPPSITVRQWRVQGLRFVVVHSRASRHRGTVCRQGVPRWHPKGAWHGDSEGKIATTLCRLLIARCGHIHAPRGPFGAVLAAATPRICGTFRVPCPCGLLVSVCPGICPGRCGYA